MVFIVLVLIQNGMVVRFFLGRGIPKVIIIEIPKNCRTGGGAVVIKSVVFIVMVLPGPRNCYS